jgi:hypothetical protein
MLTVALLIMPSMTHQMAYRGEDRNGALQVASTCAGLAMVPMTLGLGATTFVVLKACSTATSGCPVIIAEDAVCSSSDNGHDALIELFNQRFDIQLEPAKVEAILSAWQVL